MSQPLHGRRYVRSYQALAVERDDYKARLRRVEEQLAKTEADLRRLQAAVMARAQVTAETIDLYRDRRR